MIGAPFVAAFVASAINRNSFYDYPAFFSYYPYLEYWVGIFFVVTLAVAVWTRMNPSASEDDEDDSEGSKL